MWRQIFLSSQLNIEKVIIAGEKLAGVEKLLYI
jgi:hypothetical protein